MHVTYIKSVQEPWFTLLQLGIKEAEGRLEKGDFAKIKPGDRVQFVNKEFPFERQIELACSKIEHYRTFEDALSFPDSKRLGKVLPGILDVPDGVRIYRQFYSEADESKYGVVLIFF